MLEYPRNSLEQLADDESRTMQIVRVALCCGVDIVLGVMSLD